MAKHCIPPKPFDEDEEEAARIELWEKAFQLNLISPSEFSLNPKLYVKNLWNEMQEKLKVQEEKEFWLSISWVPVYEDFHEGLGYGDRFDVLLLELLETFPFNDIPNVSPIISKKNGKIRRVESRKIAALISCEDEDLESVIYCVKRSVPNIYLVKEIVWGLGFVSDLINYGEIEQDWNSDPMYSTTGEFPPKYEDDNGNHEIENRTSFKKAVKKEL